MNGPEGERRAPDRATAPVRDADRARLVRLLAERRAVDGPVAPVQEHMIQAASAGAGGLNNDLVVVKLLGPLQQDTLRRALDLLAARHDALRTHFTRPPDPRLVVRPSVRVPLRVVPAGPDGPSNSPQKVALELLTEPIDPFTGPTHRAVLVECDPEYHVLVSVLHHLVSDEYSHGLYVRDLAALYTGAGPDLPAVRPYRQYAADQHARFAEGHSAEAVRRRAAALDPPLEPIRWPRQPERRRYLQRTVSQEWPETLVGAAEAALTSGGSTLGMALAAGWAQAVHHVLGVSDVRIGTPVANRTDPRFCDSIGLFAGMAVLRLRICPQMSVASLLQEARRELLTAWQDGEVPLPLVVRRFRERHPELDPRVMFETAFSYFTRSTPVTAGHVRFDGMDEFDAEPIPMPAFQPLHLAVRRAVAGSGRPVEVRLAYDTDLVSRETPPRLLASVERFLTACAEEPGRRLADLAPGGGE